MKKKINCGLDKYDDEFKLLLKFEVTNKIRLNEDTLILLKFIRFIKKKIIQDEAKTNK